MPRPAAGSVGVVRLGEYVPAAVVLVHPRGTSRARRGVVGVVYANQLAEGVVGVRRHFAIARLRGNISPAVVLVGEVHRVRPRALRNPRHQRRGGVRSIPAPDECVSRQVRSRAVGQAPGADSPQLVARVGHLVLRIVKLHLGHAVVAVVGVGRFVALVRPAVAELFAEAVEVGLLGVLQRGTVERNAVFVAQRAPAGPVGKVVLRFIGAVQAVVLHPRHLPVRAVFVGVAFLRLRVVAHARQAVEAVVGILHLAPVSVLHFLEQPAAVIKRDDTFLGVHPCCTNPY